MILSFTERRHKNPDYSIEAWITGVQLPNGKVHWQVSIDGADDEEEAAGILEKAAIVLRQAIAMNPQGKDS